MAQICCIGSDSNINDVQKLNDVIVCVEDSHIFSDGEKELFNIIKVSGTMAEVRATMADAMPEMSTNENEEDIWKDVDGDWKIIAKLKYHVRYEGTDFISNIQRSPENFVKVD